MADPQMVSTFVLAGIIVALGVAYLYKDKIGNLSGLNLDSPGIKEFAQVLILFLPHVIMFFGPIADALNQELRQTIPSFVAFLSIFLNWGLGSLFNRIAAALKSAPPAAPIVGGAISTLGCQVPGFESQVSDQGSAPMVVTFTTASQYLIDLWQNRGFQPSISSMVSFTALAASQFIILKNNGCFSGFTSVGQPLVFSALLGVAFGGTAYGIVKSSDPGKLPSAVQLAAAGTPVGIAGTPGAGGGSSGGSGGGGGGGCSSSKPGRCTAPADDDQFVCDTQVNGIPVK